MTTLKAARRGTQARRDQASHGDGAFLRTSPAARRCRGQARTQVCLANGCDVFRLRSRLRFRRMLKKARTREDFRLRFAVGRSPWYEVGRAHREGREERRWIGSDGSSERGSVHRRTHPDRFRARLRGHRSKTLADHFQRQAGRRPVGLKSGLRKRVSVQILPSVASELTVTDSHGSTIGTARG